MPTTNEQNLEKVFSDMAFATLRDRVQGLLDYLVGFQMLKQEDEGQRAVGIFGFEIDGDYYYVPTFFLNGEIRGMDSLYSVKSDLFVPLTEDWVDHTINRRQVSLGETDTRPAGARGIRTPNYNKLKSIPGGSGGSTLKLANAMMGDPEYRVDVHLPTELAACGMTDAFRKLAEQRPGIRRSFEQFYNWLDLADHPKTARQKTAEVVIISQITDLGSEELTDAQRKSVILGDSAVIDRRPEVAKARAFRKETRQTFETPGSGGLYEVLWSDGSVGQALIGDQNTSRVFVHDLTGNRSGMIDRQAIRAVQKRPRQEFEGLLVDRGVETDACANGDIVVFFGFDGVSTAPLRILSSRSGIDGITTYDVEQADNYPTPIYTSSEKRRAHGNAASKLLTNTCTPTVNKVIVSDTGARDPRYFSDHLCLNNRHFRAVRIGKFRRQTSDNSSYEFSIDDISSSDWLTEEDFGNESTILEAMDKVAQDLSVTRTGLNELLVKTSGFTHVGDQASTLRRLIVDLGLGEDDARAIVKSASWAGETFWYQPTTKVAASLLSFPDINDTTFGGEMTEFHPEQVSYQTSTTVQSPDNRAYYEYNSPFEDGGDGGVFEAVEAAGKTGQKDVFDSAALASLVKTHNPTQLVDRFLPTIVTGMDRLGRLLFLIHWHYDEFEERYGRGELGDFIDNLKSVFEQLGDVVIFSKKKTLAGDPDHFGLSNSPAEIEDNT